MTTFRLEGRLGVGGMGNVYLATMTANGKTEQVALKRIRSDLAEDSGMLAQFQREARICSLLSHENIVSLRSYGEDADGPYLALEYVNGCSLRDLLKRDAQLPMPACLSIARDCARGLAYAHRLTQPDEEIRGIIHRDLSPENILLSRTGVAKLADFGVAKMIGGTPLTRTGTVKGKFGYLAPEMFRGQEADVLTDVFALGATLFRLVCGMAPFPGRNEAEVMHATIFAQAPRASDLRPGLPAAIDAWIAKALSKDRLHRPQGVEGLLDALEHAAPDPGAGHQQVAACVTEVLKTQESAAAQPGPASVAVAATVKARRRTLRWPALAAATAVGVAALTAAVKWPWHRPPEVAAVAPPMPVEAAPPAPAAVVGPVEVAKAPPAEAPPAVRPPPAARPLPKRHPSRAKADPNPPPVFAGKLKDTEPDAEAPAAPMAQATLWVRARPWAHVFVDGQPRGLTPMEPFALPAGRHALKLVNEDLHREREEVVVLQPNEKKELRFNLENAR